MLWRRHPETAFAPYLRGELDASESARLRAHLAGCARCRAAVAETEAVMGAVAQRVEQLAEPDWAAYQRELRRKLNARRARASAPRPANRWVWASFAAAAVATSAILLALALSGPRPPVVDQLAIESGLADADLGMLRDYPVVENLDLLENYDVIENLDQLTPPAGPHHESRSS